MNEENKERIEAHKKMYEDLVPWIMNQFEGEIKVLIPSAKITIREWYSQTIKDMIRGASVTIEVKGWFDSEDMEFLCHVLGTKDYRVTAYPLCRMHLTFKVSISNVCKSAMQCTGMWKPKGKKEDEQEK